MHQTHFCKKGVFYNDAGLPRALHSCNLVSWYRYIFSGSG